MPTAISKGQCTNAQVSDMRQATGADRPAPEAARLTALSSAEDDLVATVHDGHGLLIVQATSAQDLPG